MNIEKPIFIIGSGRSGTTILCNLLALHGDLYWFSNLTDRYPRLPALALFHRVLDAPLLGRAARKRIIRSSKFSLRPTEAETIYHIYCDFEKHRKMMAGDLQPASEKRFKRIVEGHHRATGRRRFLTKQTANTYRLPLIHQMFPDAYYIHLIRDGRAVALSLHRVRWWNKIDLWWTELTPAAWEEKGREPIELCALHWKHNVEEILNHRDLFEDRYLEITYEALVDDTRSTLRKIVAFCELSSDSQFESMIPESLPNMNTKWETDLTESQIEAIERRVGDIMEEFGYETRSNMPAQTSP